MKRLLLLLTSIIALTSAQAQCMGDSLISATPDSLYVGDTLKVNVYYDATASSKFTDSIFLSMNVIIGVNEYPYANAYLHDYTDVMNAFHPNSYGNIESKLAITSSSYFNNSSWTKVYLYTTQNNSCGPSLNVNRIYVWVKDTGSALGINEIHARAQSIREVRYYTVMGQLYGVYPQKQTHLPSVPLIEECIYTDNTVSTRSLINLR